VKAKLFTDGGARGNPGPAAFAYVLDVVPTLLGYAGVATTRNGSAPLGGLSLDALLAGRSLVVHAATEAIGYEAAGGAVVYLGDKKLVRNVPPYGDGKWRLYDLGTDPTEVRDLSAGEPQLVREILAAYAAYVAKNGVVEVPEGYDVIKQGQANAANRQ